MPRNFVKILVFAVIGFFILKTVTTCSSNREYYSFNEPSQGPPKKVKTKVDKLADSLSNLSDFTLILNDMTAEDALGDSMTYKHRYLLINSSKDSLELDTLGWYAVSPVFFNDHVNDLGMQLLAKKDGALIKQAAPAGVTNYVGNERYGSWRQRDGYSFWEFYGQYAFMSSMLNLFNPMRRSYYNDYYGGYYGTGRSYYGPAGNPAYGTSRYTRSSQGKNTTWGSKNPSFKNKVRGRVAKSSAAIKARRYSSRSSYSRSSKTSRSSSRWGSGGSSYRSRSGGFGK